MTFTHALSTNNYGSAKFIVATSAAEGTHTTLAAAMAAASAGDTIFLRNSVTESVTITPGVNIACWFGNSLNTPTITGKLTMTGAGTSTISGIKLSTNSDFVIAVTGSAASILNLFNCYLDISNNTGISFTSSSSSAIVYLQNCNGNLGTTGIAYFAHSSAGTLRIDGGLYDNTGASTTANTCSSGNFFPIRISLGNPTTISSTGVISASYTYFNVAPVNATALTITSATVHVLYFCSFSSGTASAISVGSGATLTLDFADVISSNTNAITGAGTVQFGLVMYGGSSSGNNATTQNPLPTQASGWKLIQTLTASSSATLSFTSGITTTFNSYVFVLRQLVPQTNGVSFNMVVSTNGGSSYLNSGYLGFSQTLGSGGTGTRTSTTTIPLEGTASNISNSTTYGFNGVIFMNNVTSGTNSAAVELNCTYANGTPIAFTALGGGFCPVSSVINAVQFAFSSGNINSGTISMYGISQ